MSDNTSICDSVRFCAQIARNQVVTLLKQSRIGPAVDLDVLLMAIIHDHMKGECPRVAWLFPRRITDGRLPALSIVGGAALSSSSIPATGTALSYIYKHSSG
jgi:hypothetical protein